VPSELLLKVPRPEKRKKEGSALDRHPRKQGASSFNSSNARHGPERREEGERDRQTPPIRARKKRKKVSTCFVTPSRRATAGKEKENWEALREPVPPMERRQQKGHKKTTGGEWPGVFLVYPS